ncbi:MAG: LysR family transcriptional regulator [Roseibium sp.]|uniref:LysR substrate-binding domain-containing protein n=1 Tax=Roseibium sp. TaxID=1936156 RepID=UPI00260EA660|nr:LysR substrate-binding domain-containing protein [Roseibium sp.]MCV0428956.1 LysR family transcriptional regulator [Roseibium sp.]
MSRLPSFSSLLAFDAVARHGTLTRAAQELNVSQPAVSRRLAMLEEDLGCCVVDRGTRPLKLTAEGQELFDVLRSGLARIEAVVERLRDTTAPGTVSVACGSGFAAYWLIPRLPELEQAMPETSIQIISQAHTDDKDTADVNIRFGDGDWQGLEVGAVLGEDVFPVASPAYVALKGGDLTVDALKAERLLGQHRDTGAWYNWETWFDAVGSPVRTKLRTLDFDSYALMVNAALAGQGVCLCWAGLLDVFLESGALVRLTDVSAGSGRGYFVTFREDEAQDSPVRQVADWMIANRSYTLQS